MKFPMYLQMFAEGVEEPTVTEPATDGNTEPVVEEVVEPNNQPSEPVRDRGRDSQFAAARRNAEKEYNERIARRDAEFERRFGHIVNPDTGLPIRSEADYFAALDAQQRVQQEEDLRQKGIDPALLTQAIENNPIVKQARQLLEENQRAETERALDSQIREIGKLDPSIKSFEDLAKMPNFAQFDKLARSGYDLVNAYKIANYETASASAANAARQAALNNAKGQSHLGTTQSLSGDGTTGVDIPAGQLARWRECFPEATDAELKAKYNRAIKATS